MVNSTQAYKIEGGRGIPGQIRASCSLVKNTSPFFKLLNMETKEELKKWQFEYYKKLSEQLSSLDPIKKYYLSSDEGGMMGNPRFLISNIEAIKPYFEQIGYLTKDTIKNFILGRMATWIIDLRDYSTTTQIIIE
jgi:hypothetical protein